MSTLRTNTLSNAAGSASVPVDTVINGSAKAWVNFNGTGTVAIRAAFNVSSITDNGTGDYTVNFTTAMTDVNYAIAGAAILDTSGSGYGISFGAPYNNTSSTTAARVSTGTPANLRDCTHVSVAIFR